MLPPAALHIIDRFLAALMALMTANADPARRDTRSLTEIAALTLHLRLNRLLTHLIRLATFGIPAPPGPKPPAEPPGDAAPPEPAARARIGATFPTLPRRRGWLLQALPHTAPAVATALRALIADPAAATLLQTAPSLPRLLNPLLRALGLDPATSPQPRPPAPTSPPHPPPRPAPPTLTIATPAPPPTKNHLSSTRLFHALTVPVS